MNYPRDKVSEWGNYCGTMRRYPQRELDPSCEHYSRAGYVFCIAQSNVHTHVGHVWVVLLGL